MAGTEQERPPTGPSVVPSAPTGPALHHQPTAAAVRTYLGRAFLKLLVGLVMLAGVIGANFLVQSRAEELLRTGQRVPGRVVEVKAHDIVISYEAEGRARRATMKIPDAATTFHVDQAMELIYDPAIPTG